MTRNLLIITTAAALAAIAPATLAQLQPGSDLGLPSTGTSADTAGAAGTAPRSTGSPNVTSGAATSVGVSGAHRDLPPTTHSGRCHTLVAEERERCLREEAAGAAGITGPIGPGGVGMGPGAGAGVTTGPGGAAATPGR
ncbi:MAG TPA: hypothetical protein VM489_13900 [Burkholderiales bacterium]|nr:hypothetical protein [Burkholderiales bacterium]